MLNILWSGMIIAGILYSVVTGNVSDISNAALDSSKEAVTLCITMLGVMAFWCGLMQIAEDAGLVEKNVRENATGDTFSVSAVTEKSSGQ